MEQFKRCVQCKKIKGISLFYKNKSKPDGLQNMCKDCTKENDTKRNKSGKRAKYYIEYYRLRIKTDEKFHEKEKIRAKEYYKRKSLENPEIYKENRKENRKREYQKNREKYILKAYKRLKKYKNTKGSFNRKQLEAKFSLYGNRCAYCGSAEKITIDHVIPLNRNGTHFPANLVPCCQKCNSAKRDRKGWIPHLPHSNISTIFHII